MLRSDTDETKAIEHVVDELAADYRGTYDVDQVAAAVHTIHERFDGQPIRDFVPLLVERTAREELGTPQR